MPELPEVETVCNGIAPILTGARLIRARNLRPNLRLPFPVDFTARLEGSRVIGVKRRAKYILVSMDAGFHLLWHLGMSGRVSIDEVGNDWRHGLLKHDHAVLVSEHGKRIRFNDARRFGLMVFVEAGEEESHALLRDIGPEPLSNSFNGPLLHAALRARSSPVKTALLDQRLVAGLGNIYVCEALFRAGIHPLRKSNAISMERVERLVAVIRQTLAEAIAAGGSTLKDFVQPDGELGYFQHRFRVYGRAGEACSNGQCEGKIRRLVQSGRSSFYCPRCQR